MALNRTKILIINGIRDDGTVDDVRANSLGQINFSTAGSCHVSTYLPRDQFIVNQFVLDHHEQQQVSIRYILSHAVIFCEISDPDSHSVALRKARELYDVSHGRIAWINNPHYVKNTRRDTAAKLLANIEGVKAPRTLRLKAGSIVDVQNLVVNSLLQFPILVRPTGSHGGKDLVLIEKREHLGSLDLSRYPEAFITEFVDFGNQGIYSKYRFAVVAGRPYLRHVLFYDDWMVHSAARAFTSDRPDLQRLESEILASFEQDLKPKIQKRVGDIYRQVGLDYFGIDCAMVDGQIVLFEVNANMNILHNNQPLPNIWEKAIEEIVNSIVNTLILPRVSKSALSGKQPNTSA